jgi:hypothetical protein
MGRIRSKKTACEDGTEKETEAGSDCDYEESQEESDEEHHDEKNLNAALPPMNNVKNPFSKWAYRNAKKKCRKTKTERYMMSNNE